MGWWLKGGGGFDIRSLFLYSIYIYLMPHVIVLNCSRVLNFHTDYKMFQRVASRVKRIVLPNCIFSLSLSYPKKWKIFIKYGIVNIVMKVLMKTALNVVCIKRGDWGLEEKPRRVKIDCSSLSSGSVQSTVPTFISIY